MLWLVSVQHEALRQQVAASGRMRNTALVSSTFLFPACPTCLSDFFMLSTAGFLPDSWRHGEHDLPLLHHFQKLFFSVEGVFITVLISFFIVGLLRLTCYGLEIQPFLLVSSIDTQLILKVPNDVCFCGAGHNASLSSSDFIQSFSLLVQIKSGWFCLSLNINSSFL